MSYTKDKMTIVKPYRNPASTATFAGPLDLPTGTWNWHPMKNGSDRSTGEITLLDDGSLTTVWSTHKGGYWEMMPNGLVKLVFKKGGIDHIMSYAQNEMTIVVPHRNPASKATRKEPLW